MVGRRTVADKDKMHLPNSNFSLFVQAPCPKVGNNESTLMVARSSSTTKTAQPLGRIRDY